MTTLSAFQPHYLPTVADVFKMRQGEVLLFADHLHYRKQSLITHAILPTLSQPLKISVPVTGKNLQNKKIYEISMDTFSHWWRKHLRTIELNFKYAPYFEYYFDDFSALFQNLPTRLSDFLFRIWEWHRETLFPEKTLFRSSAIGIQDERTLIQWMHHQGLNAFLILKEEQSYYHSKFAKSFPLEVVELPLITTTLPFSIQPETPFLLMLFYQGPQALQIFNHQVTQ